MKKPSHPEVFDRLDQAYRYWEEEMWRKKILRSLFTLNDAGYLPDITEKGYPVDGHEDTRTMLLEAATREDLSYLLPAFRSQGIETKPAYKEDGGLSPESKASVYWNEFHFPYYLGEWNAQSRRIYYLPRDLILMLQATSLKGYTFRDIHYPLPSFALALEYPITAGNEELDFFLFSGKRDPEVFYGFSRKFRGWRPIDPTVRQKINKAVRDGNRERLLGIGRKIIKQVPFGAHIDMWTSRPWLSSVDGDPDVDIEKDMKAAMHAPGALPSEDWTDKLFRVVLGFTFYLQAFQESHKDLVQRVSVDYQRPQPTSFGKAIVSPEDVFRVQSLFELSSEERIGLTNYFSGRGGWEINTHFREGHWRRPPGEGGNPLAQKTIWVRPTMVRRDRLPENCLPMGSSKMIPSA